MVAIGTLAAPVIGYFGVIAALWAAPLALILLPSSAYLLAFVTAELARNLRFSSSWRFLNGRGFWTALSLGLGTVAYWMLAVAHEQAH